MEAKGHVTIKIETFDNGVRTNIECFSISKEAFLDGTSPELRTNMRIAMDHARKEILTPTPKTDMA
jgi:hypothetical protein